MAAQKKAKTKMQIKSKTPVRNKPKSIVLGKPKPVSQASSKPRISKTDSSSITKVRVVNKISAPHLSPAERKLAKGLRVPQYAYMKAPGLTHDFQVGDTVEVYCDHEKNKDRIRGWINGTVVQVDNKMVAVQFRSNVYLTDGWMVPDRILWYPLNSEHIRPVFGKKSAKREKAIPEY